jgi:transposase
MFIVESIAKIRRMHFVDGKGVKAIARELGISKNTVRKIIRSGATKFELSSHQKTKRVLGDYLTKLQQLLLANLKEPLRRRLTAKKVYELLKADGYSGSYESINLYVKQFRLEQEAKGKTAFIPLSFEMGQAFQFDWGLEEVEIAGNICRVKAARIKLCYSRHSLVVVYPNEQLEMVIAAHNEAFNFFDGTCKSGIYDNMRTAVTKRVNNKPEFNERFLQMASHYLFEPIACTPASGWEKGRVEKQVGDNRRNFFTPLLKGNSYQDINEQLRQMCINWSKDHKHPELDQTIYEAYEQEKPHLIPCGAEFSAYTMHPTVVSSLSLVIYDTNSYSVECAYVGLSVQIKAYAWEIIIIHKEKVIGKHSRSFNRNDHIYDPWHYVPILERKPGSLRNGAPFKNLVLPEAIEEIKQQLLGYQDGNKQFIAILLYITRYGLDAVTKACSKVLKTGSCSSELVNNYLQNNNSNAVQQEFISLKEPPNASCEHYNHLYLSEASHEVN